MRALPDVRFLRHMSGIGQGTTTENLLRWGCVTCIRCATCVPTVLNAFASGPCQLRRFTFPASTARSAWRVQCAKQACAEIRPACPGSIVVQQLSTAFSGGAWHAICVPTLLNDVVTGPCRPSPFHFPGVNCGQCAKRSPFVQMSSCWCARSRVVPSALSSAWCVAPISSHRKISWSVEAAILDVLMIASLWNFTCILAALLPAWLSNFRAVWKVKTRISLQRDITRSYVRPGSE